MIETQRVRFIRSCAPSATAEDKSESGFVFRRKKTFLLMHNNSDYYKEVTLIVDLCKAKRIKVKIIFNSSNLGSLSVSIAET